MDIVMVSPEIPQNNDMSGMEALLEELLYKMDITNTCLVYLTAALILLIVGYVAICIVRLVYKTFIDRGPTMFD